MTTGQTKTVTEQTVNQTMKTGAGTRTDSSLKIMLRKDGNAVWTPARRMADTIMPEKQTNMGTILNTANYATICSTAQLKGMSPGRIRHYLVILLFATVSMNILTWHFSPLKEHHCTTI